MSEQSKDKFIIDKKILFPVIAFIAGVGVMAPTLYFIPSINDNSQSDIEQQLIKQNQTINLLLNATGKQLQFDKSVSDWSKTVEQRINLLNQTQGKK